MTEIFMAHNKPGTFSHSNHNHKYLSKDLVDDTNSPNLLPDIQHAY